MKEIQTIEIGLDFLYNGIKEKRSVDMGKKVGIIVGVLVLLLAAAGGIYYYMTNTPKNKYLLSEKQSMETWGSYFDERFKNEVALQDEMVNESYRGSVKLSAEVSDSLLSSLGVPASMVESTNLVFNAGHDEKNQQSELSFVPTFAGTEIDKFEWTADKDAQYIAAPLFNDKLMVKNADMKKVYERIAGEPAPEDFDPSMLNLNELMASNMTQEEAEEMQYRYLKVVMDSLEDEQFEKGKETTDVFGKKEELNTVTMTLEDADIKRVLKNVGAELKKDEKIKKMFGSSITSVTTKSYEESIDDLLKDIDDEKFGKIVAKNFLDGKTIVKRDINWTGADGKEDNNMLFTMTEKVDDDVQVVAELKSSDQAVESFRLEGTSKGKGTVKDDYTVTSITEGEEFAINMKNDEKLDGNKRTNNIDFTITDQTGETYNAKYEGTLDSDVKNNKQTSKGTISFDVDGEPIKINIDTTTNVKEKLNVKADGAVDLNTLSDAELQELQDSIETNMEMLFSQFGA